MTNAALPRYPVDMIMFEGQAPFIEDGDDFTACAEALAGGGWPGEFAIAPPPGPDAAEAAACAGFMPMSVALQAGPALLLPKLHLERCLLDPAAARVTGTVRRQASRFSIGLNAAFDEVLARCAGVHGDGWLTPELRACFSSLHRERAGRRAAWLSVELWHEGALVAGEIGYLIGASYASLSGYRDLSGAGSVQLAALGALLAREGVETWDLGMGMPYKLALGGRNLPREEYLPMLREAYGLPRAESLVARKDPVPCRGLLGPRPRG